MRQRPRRQTYQRTRQQKRKKRKSRREPKGTVLEDIKKGAEQRRGPADGREMAEEAGGVFRLRDEAVMHPHHLGGLCEVLERVER